VHDPASLQTLAPVAGFLTLLELAAGTVSAAFGIDLIGKVGRGFVGSTAVICAAVMGVVQLIGIGLPTDIPLLTGTIPQGALSSLLHWNLAFIGVLLAFAFMCATGTDPARRVAGVITVAIGGVVIGKAAAAFGPALGGWFPALAVFVPGALLTGSALGGMLLGHWYLVAPSLSFRPLRQMVNVVFAAVAVQAAVLAAALLTAAPPARHSLLLSNDALPFWLLVVGAGLVFTTGVGLLIRHFARIRSNQSATAMLYVLIISVLIGVVPGHLLFFTTGTPV
jgi:hypothetical protein